MKIGGARVVIPDGVSQTWILCRKVLGVPALRYRFGGDGIEQESPSYWLSYRRPQPASPNRAIAGAWAGLERPSSSLERSGSSGT